MKCTHPDRYEWSQAGAGVQFRCVTCDWFIAWKELPRSSAKKEKSNGRKSKES